MYNSNFRVFQKKKIDDLSYKLWESVWLYMVSQFKYGRFALTIVLAVDV